MRKVCLLGSLAIFLLVHWADGGPLQPFGDEKGFRAMVFQPFHTQTHSLTCKARERSCVIVYGRGTSPMAIYVYDAYGNCVARDDVSQGKVSDDLAVEWYPAAQDVYDIEIRNLGRKLNQAEVAIR
jgi:hypothetical protein